MRILLCGGPADGRMYHVAELQPELQVFVDAVGGEWHSCMVIQEPRPALYRRRGGTAVGKIPLFEGAFMYDFVEEGGGSESPRG